MARSSEDTAKVDGATRTDESGIKALWRKGEGLWAEFAGINAGTCASSIAYFTFLSLIPLLTLCISLITQTGLGEGEVAEFFVSIVPETFADFARTVIGDAFRRSGVAFSLSSITLLWSASQGVRALHSSLNAAYGEKETRNPFVIIAISIGAAIVFGVLFVVTIYLVFGGAVTRAIAPIAPGLEQNGDVLNILNAAAMAVLGSVALSACYAYLPAGQRRFAAQLPGAALASLSCGALTIGFHVYVDNFCNVDALYGSIATVALFLFWLYLVAFILIAGAFLNRLLANRESEPFSRLRLQ